MKPRRLIVSALAAAAASAFQIWVVSQTVMWETTSGKVGATLFVIVATFLLAYFFVYRRAD